MSGNAPRVVKQAVQKEGQEWRSTGDATDEPAPQDAPGRGRRLGGSKQEGGGRAEPPKTGESGAIKTAERQKPRSGKNRGAVKIAGEPQGGTKSEPATQVTGKGRLGGKKGGRRNRRSRTPKQGAKRRPWGTGKGRPGRQNSRSEKSWRSGRGVPETGYLGVKIAGQKKTWRSGRRVAKREQTCREKEQPDLAARSEQKEKEQGMIRNHRPKKQPSSCRSWGNTYQKKRSRRPASGKHWK